MGWKREWQLNGYRNDFHFCGLYQCVKWGWSDGAKVSCILCHWGDHLISAYSLVRLAILVAARVEGKCFYCFCFFTFVAGPLSSLSLSFISSTISSISFLPFSGRRHKMTHKGWHVVKPQHNHSNQRHFSEYHNICFHGEIRKNINTVSDEKYCLELCHIIHNIGYWSGPSSIFHEISKFRILFPQN